MAIKVATRSASGLRAQGTGGQTALSAYQTIDHYLRRALSPAHADLFAEPNVAGQGGAIDWYSEVAATVPPQPLTAVPPERGAALYARLATLVNDIRARAEELRNSSRQSDRLLGQLLLLALEVPGEDCIYAIGDQPVLIFWGHLADVPMPQSGVIDRMIAASRKTKVAPAASAATPAAEVAATAAAAVMPVALAAKPPRYRWLPPVLWSVFTVLCVVIGFELLRACGLGLPGQDDVSRLLVNYCPLPINDAAALELQNLQSQNSILQGQLDRLLGQTAGRQKQCALQPTPVVVPPIQPPIQPPVKPPAKPSEPGQQLQIPEKPTNKSFLSGCWGGPSNIDNKPVMERYCFNENGEGKVTFSGQDGLQCEGAVHATLVQPGPHLVIRREPSQCNNQQSIIARTINCAQDSQGQTECTENQNGTPFGITLRRLAGPAAQ